MKQLFYMEMIRMKYAIYFTWNDGFQDSFSDILSGGEKHD